MTTNPPRLFWIVCTIIGLAYAICFPFAYFRHDDWGILGEGLYVLEDWSRLWLPSFKMSGGEERIWFLRPWFKLFPILVFRAGGGLHAPFLLLHVLFLAGGTYFAFRALERVADTARAWIWVILSVSLFHSHAGSVLWLGEGMMNLPILFLLSLNLYLFVHRKTPWLAVGVFLFTLGFKEASVFHVLFLAALAWRHPEFSLRDVRPYFILGGIYFVFRMTAVPVNPGYLPKLDATVVGPLLHLVEGVGLTVLALGAVAWAGGARWNWHRLLPFVPFAGISLAPYVGHPFFSPGWLTLPLFFLSWAVLYGLGDWNWTKRVQPVVLALLVVNLLGCAYQLKKRHWFSWGPIGMRFVEIVKRASPQTQVLWVEWCSTRPRKGPPYTQVVGDTEMTWKAWRVLRGTELVSVEWNHCQASTPDARNLVIEYAYPELRQRSPRG